jgi:hypothetical protein
MRAHRQTRHAANVGTLVVLLVFAMLLSVPRQAAAANGSISINDVSVIEGNSGTVNATFTISLSVADAAATSVNFATANGTASSASDYTATSGVATIPANATSTTVTVVVKGDTSVEANETFFVNLSNPTNTATIADAQGIGTIQNDDTRISIANVTVTEDSAGPGASFAVTLSAASALPVSVTYATANGTAVAGADYTAAGATVLTFAPGETAKQIVIPITADTIDEDNETFSVNLTTPVNATLNNNKGTGTIVDDDLPPTISITNQSVVEGNTGATSIMPFTIALSGASGKVITVKYQSADSTATAPADYTALPLTTLTFQPGTVSQNVNAIVKGDTLAEGNESFTINLSALTNATYASTQGVGTIVDDDAQPTISIANVTVAEPAAGTTTATFVVALSSASGQPITVNYTTADGTATAGLDYAAQSGTVTFAPGVTTQPIAITINSDQLVEPDETFSVNLSAPSNATILKGQAIGTITSTAGVPAVSVSGATVTEGANPNATFAVTLSAPSPTAVTVTYTVAGVTAIAGSDFQVPATLQLVFQPNTTSQTIVVPILDDVISEDSETFSVTLTGATGASVGSGTATGTILDNDPPPAISINDVQVSDAGGTPNAIFTVSLSAPSSRAITVAFQTTNGSAVAGQDYVAQTGTLTIPAGATSATISVPILSDTLVEGNETFTVNLGNPTNATLAKAAGTGTIGDGPQGAPSHFLYLTLVRR